MIDVGKIAGTAGFTIIRSDILPAGTIVVSADVYEQLKESPEQRKKRTDQQIAELKKFGQLVADLTTKAETPKVCECGPLRNVTDGGHFPACTRCKRRLKP
jgi:hypothetical protein